MMSIKDTATSYLNAGLSVLPAHRIAKRPAVNAWKVYQTRLPALPEINAWFGNPQEGVCVIAGAVSGNLEMIDFDFAGEFFGPWQDKVKTAMPGLIDKLVIETTQSGGWHVVYRSQDPVDSSMKLAQRRIPVKAENMYLTAGKETVRLCGKEYAVRSDPSGKYVIGTFIETRGEGGLFLCAPTEGYVITQGSFLEIPVLTSKERDIVLMAAWELNEYHAQAEPIQAVQLEVSKNNTLRPGDDYDQRGDVRSLLQSHGWQYACRNEVNELWRRPGKKNCWSASLRISDRRFYIFSSNGHPFESNQDYRPFAVYATLEHNGDFSKAAKALAEQGYGEKLQLPAEDNSVDLSGIVCPPEDIPLPPSEESLDPGPFPDTLLRIPGFISELVDFCLETAPYPNLGLAFCGAVAMQSLLCGRKVRDCGNLRTNLFLLALAGSSSGKDWARQLNVHIMMEINKLDALGDKFASGEGIQDAMFITPSMLFQNDEIDGMLISLNKSRDARFESLMGTMLTMSTSSGSMYPMRRKAGKQSAGVIDQPHLTIFGTATPKYYYESLSERMLCNGFFARMIVVDIGYRGKGKDAGLVDSMPKRILETAKWWDSFVPGQQRGNLLGFHPIPQIVTATQDAQEVLNQFRYNADEEYAKSEADNNESAKTIWGRANENARKLALIYACSENHPSPEISQAAALWAVDFVDHQIRRMLYLAGQHIFENEFDRKCKLFLQFLAAWEKQKGKSAWMPHWELGRRLKGWTEKDFEMVRESLLARWQIEFEAGSTNNRGRSGCRYRRI